MSGWEGSAADATVWMNARLMDLPILADKFYLADAGFGACDALLTPYHGARYHLAEWGHAAVRYIYVSIILIFFLRPETWEELYNLQHAQARNFVE